MEKFNFSYYTQMFSKIFDFRGKSNLKEYWIPVVYNLLFSICASLIALPFIIDFKVFYGVAISLASLYEVVVFVPMLALTVRRLHDANHSARSFLWLLLPFVGEIIFIIYLASPSNSTLNLWPFSAQTTSNKSQNSSQSANLNNQELFENKEQINDLKAKSTEEHNEQNVTKFDEISQTDSGKNDENTTDTKNSVATDQSQQKDAPVIIDESKVSISDTNLSRSERIKILQKLHESGEVSDEEYHKKVIEILKK